MFSRKRTDTEDRAMAELRDVNWRLHAITLTPVSRL